MLQRGAATIINNIQVKHNSTLNNSQQGLFKVHIHPRCGCESYTQETMLRQLIHTKTIVVLNNTFTRIRCTASRKYNCNLFIVIQLAIKFDLEGESLTSAQDEVVHCVLICVVLYGVHLRTQVQFLYLQDTPIRK